MSNISKFDEYFDFSFALQTIFQKLEAIDDLESEIANLKNANDQSFKHRMSYLTWTLANPVSIICIPIILSIFVELWLNNFDKPISAWQMESLTKSTNWITPIIVATIAIFVTTGNKLYLLIQESGDMSLLLQLRSEINGLGKRMDREFEKRDAQVEKRDAQVEKRDIERQEEHKALMIAINAITNRMVRVETIVETSK